MVGIDPLEYKVAPVKYFLVFLLGAIAVGGAAFAFAQNTRTVEVETTASVEVRVWRNVADPGRLHLSTAPPVAPGPHTTIAWT